MHFQRRKNSLLEKLIEWQATEPFSWMTRPNQGTSTAVLIQQIGSSLPGQIGQWPPTVGDTFLTGTPINYPNGVPWDLSFELISSCRTVV